MSDVGVEPSAASAISTSVGANLPAGVPLLPGELNERIAQDDGVLDRLAVRRRTSGSTSWPVSACRPPAPLCVP